MKKGKVTDRKLNRRRGGGQETKYINLGRNVVVNKYLATLFKFVTFVLTNIRPFIIPTFRMFKVLLNASRRHALKSLFVMLLWRKRSQDIHLPEKLICFALIRVSILFFAVCKEDPGNHHPLNSCPQFSFCTLFLVGWV